MYKAVQIASLWVLLAFSHLSLASMAGAEICVSASVIEPTLDAPVGGFSERCVKVSGAADERTGSWSGQAQEEIFWGGCNTSGTEQAFAIQFTWNYAIVTDAGEGEQASARAHVSLSEDAYTEGSGQETLVINDTIPDQLCLDGVIEIAVSARALNAASERPIPGPGRLVVLIAFLMAMWVFRDDVFPQTKR